MLHLRTAVINSSETTKPNSEKYLNETKIINLIFNFHWAKYYHTNFNHITASKETFHHINVFFEIIDCANFKSYMA